MPFILRTFTGVPKGKIVRVQKWLKALEEATEIKHWVPVLVFADESLPTGDAEYGNFIHWVTPYRACRIEIATGKANAETILDTLCHEVTHYEQWRDGKAISDRWVANRVDELTEEIQSLSVATIASSRRVSKAKPAGGSVGSVRRKRA